MAVYQKPFTNLTLSTTNSTWQLLPTATNMGRILEHYIGGESTSSTVLRHGLARTNAAGTGTTPTAYTPNKLNIVSPAASSTVYGALAATVAWGTLQETLNDPIVVQAFNTFGGTDRWVPQPGEEFYFGGTAATTSGISARSLSGTPVVSGMCIFEEL
jgi:hypothetical protein